MIGEFPIADTGMSETHRRSPETEPQGGRCWATGVAVTQGSLAALASSPGVTKYPRKWLKGGKTYFRLLFPCVVSWLTMSLSILARRAWVE